MPFTAGVFTPTIIGAAKVNEQELLANSRITELQREIVAGAAILNNQDPNIVTTGFGELCMNADIYTLRSGSTDKGNKTIACEVGLGPEAGSEKISLTKGCDWLLFFEVMIFATTYFFIMDADILL